MRKIAYVFIFMCLILSGCTYPKFYEDTQMISFNLPTDTVLNIEEYGDVSSDIQVKRSFSPLKVTLSKKGFKGKKIEIKSHFTDDKWARISLPGESGGMPVAAYLLLPLSNTIIFPFWEETRELNITAWSAGIVNDVRNLITLSLLRAVVWNPWYEYDRYLDLTKEILVPTLEFEKECHSKKNTFIGNNDCLTCLAEKEVVSTEEECNRCANREWLNNRCYLK